MSEYEYDKNKPGDAATAPAGNAPGMPNAGSGSPEGNWESDDWSMRSSSVDEDDPLIKLARLMEQNERNFEVAAQRSADQVAEPVPEAPQPVAQAPVQDEWSQEYTPQAPVAPPQPEPVAYAPAPSPEPAVSPLSRSLHEPAAATPQQPAEPAYVPQPEPVYTSAPAEPLVTPADLNQAAMAPPPISVDMAPASAPVGDVSNAGEEQHDPFAPGGSSRPLPDRDFDVSRMPRAIRPEVPLNQAQINGLHGQASDDLAAPVLPSAEADFTEASFAPPAARRPEPAVAPAVAPAVEQQNPIAAELTRYADAVQTPAPEPVAPQPVASQPAAVAPVAPPAPVAEAPVQQTQPELAAAVQPASELVSQPIAQPDFSYLREVEDLRVPAAPRVHEAELPLEETDAEEVVAVQDADILYEEYEDDEGGGLFASRGMMVAAGVVAFVVLGGAALLAYQAIFSGDDSGPPPLVMADKSPVRILPDGQAADGGASSDIGSLSESGTASDGQLVSRVEEPVTNLNPNIDQGRSVRIVENNQGVSSTSDPLGPRPVRTFVVRPDGSIVSNSATGTTNTATNNSGIQPRIVTTQPVAGNGATTSAPANNSGIAIPRPRPGSSGNLTSNAGSTTQVVAGTGSRATLPVAPRVSVGTSTSPTFNQNAPAVQPSTTTTVPARVPTGNTIPATTAQPAQPATTAAAPTQSGDFVVQVSSQRSEEAARSAYAGLQRRFPSVLGNQSPDIARADLGSRGVFYRVRVGPMETRDAAASLCQSLKNAGGDCIVARR